MKERRSWRSASNRWVLAITIGAVVFACHISPAIGAFHIKAYLIAAILAIMAGLAVRFCRAPLRLPYYAVGACLVSAVLIATALPGAPDSFPEIRIGIDADSGRRVAGGIDVRLLSSPYAGRRDFQGDGWRREGDIFHPVAAQPEPLHYRGRWAPYARLRLGVSGEVSAIRVQIGGDVQRIEVAGGKSYAEVLLPEGTASWRGVMQRVATAAAVALMLIMLLQRAMYIGTAATVVFALTILAGAAAYWHVADWSHAGPLELVAFEPESTPAQLELDAGHGFTEPLASPVSTGSARTYCLPMVQSGSWTLEAGSGTLTPIHQRFATGTATMAGGTATCPSATRQPCLWQFEAADLPSAIAVRNGDLLQWLPLPAATAGTPKLFLLMERTEQGMVVRASTAYLNLSPWDSFSGWIARARLTDASGRPITEAVRIDSASLTYRTLPAPDSDGSLPVPRLDRPSTSSVKVMALLASTLASGAVLLFATLFHAARMFGQAYASGARLPVVLSLCATCLCLGLGALAGWPAIINWDGFHPYIYAQTGALDLWYGIGYPLVVGAFLMLGPPWLISLYSLLATAAILLTVAAWALRSGRPIAIWGTVIVLAIWLPLSSVMAGAMTHVRDTMNGLLLAAFYLGSFGLALTWPRLPAAGRWFSAAALLLVGSLLATFRTDNIPSLLLVIGSLILLRQGVSRRTVASIVMVSAVFAGSGGIAERYLFAGHQSIAAEKDNYKVAALVNPLTGVLSVGASLPEELRRRVFASLDQVMDARYAVGHWSPYHIFYWHDTSGSRQKPLARDVAELRSTYFKVLAADPVLFLTLRTATFGGLLGHPWFHREAYPPMDYMDDWIASHSAEQIRVRELYGFSAARHPFPALTSSWQKLVKRTMTHLPQLLLLVLALLLYRRCPVSAIIALAVVVRIGIFYIFAPAAIYLYLYDLHLVGLLMPLLLAIEDSYRHEDRHQHAGLPVEVGPT